MPIRCLRRASCAALLFCALPAVGTPFSASLTGMDSAGAAFVLSRNQGGSGRWGLLERLDDSSPDELDLRGSSVAIFGQRAVIGSATAPLDRSGSDDHLSPITVFTHPSKVERILHAFGIGNTDA